MSRPPLVSHASLAAALLVPALCAPAAAAVLDRSPSPARPGEARLDARVARATFDPAAARTFRAARGGRLELPLADGTSLALELEPYEVLAPGARVIATGPRGERPITPDVTVFRGRVAGEPGSRAVVSLSRDRMLASVESRRGAFAVAPVRGEPGVHAIGEAADVTASGAAFVCGADALAPARPLPTAEEIRRATPLGAHGTGATPTRLVCRMAVETDNDFLNKFAGDVEAAAGYVVTVFATVSLLYERDINTALALTYLNVWEAGDPYVTTNTSDRLGEVLNYWNANLGGVSRDLVHHISGANLGGGIAYINALCSYGFGYAVSAIDATHTYPTNTTTWDINVVAHETGHNFGSPHTQSCYWQSNGFAPAGALLDSCHTAEGGCYAGPINIVPPDKGTVMSYCHLDGAIANTVRNEFHAACRTLMRNVAESSCLAAAAIQPPRNLVAANTSSGVDLSWTASPTAGVIRYDVYRSPVMFDLAPTFLGSTTGTTFPDAVLGTYYYRVRAARAADSSGYSNEVRAVPCAPAAPVPFVTGNVTVAAVRGDWNEDGIADLAAVNSGPGENVSILLGSGAGGVGNGGFGAATNYAMGAATIPRAIAAGDFNEDGIADLVVALNEGSGVKLMTGQGAGGTGNGTFAVGSLIATAASPEAIAVGDFNEDGIADLAVPGTAGQMSIRLGQGTGGVGNGTFAPAVNQPCGSGARAIVTADFNADGILDLAVAAATGANVFLGQGADGIGNGTFAPFVSYGAGTTPYAIATGDFDEDGATDLALANDNSGNVSVLSGNGDGTFAAAVQIAAGPNPRGIVAADLTGDGIADLAVSNSNAAAASVSLLIGRGAAGVGDGSFEAGQAFPAGSTPRGLVPGDFDEDGRLDLAACNAASAGRVNVVKTTCTAGLPVDLAITAPNGGETWITPDPGVITWSRGAGIIAVDVQVSRDGGANWETVATAETDTSFTWNATDPYTTTARVRVVDSAVPERFDMSDADFTIIPGSLLAVAERGAPGLAIARLAPNPARGALWASFMLADGGAATLELLDLSGRRVSAIDVGGLGAGAHRAELGRGATLAPGVYVVRLSQGGRAVTAKAVVLR